MSDVRCLARESISCKLPIFTLVCCNTSGKEAKIFNVDCKDYKGYFTTCAMPTGYFEGRGPSLANGQLLLASVNLVSVYLT